MRNKKENHYHELALAFLQEISKAPKPEGENEKYTKGYEDGVTDFAHMMDSNF